MNKLDRLSSRKKPILIVAAAVVVFAVLLLFAIFVMPGLLASPNQKAEDDIKSYLTQINTDLKTEQTADSELLEYLHQTYSLEIIKIDKMDEDSIAFCRIVSPDMSFVLDDVYQELSSEDAEINYNDMQEQIMEAVLHAPDKEFDVEVTLIAGENDQAIPEISEALLDAIYGGLISYTYDYFEMNQTDGE